MSVPLQIIPIQNIGEVTSETNLSEVLLQALVDQSLALDEKDVLVITQKIISKWEGQVIHLDTITPSAFAKHIAKTYDKDAAHIEVILQESKRIVRMDHGVIIAETHHGFICANAGVDQSNVGNTNTVTLLPQNPDASAKNMYEQLHTKTGVKDLGVIISDTWGRPWREGQVNFAIGSYGIDPLKDYRGEKDANGYILQVSLIAIADELAAAAELVMGKSDSVPVALIRGYNFPNDTLSSAATLIREPGKDMFR